MFLTNHSSAFLLHDVRVVKNFACLSSLMSILQRWCNVLKTMLKQRWILVANWRRTINPDSTLKQRPFYNVNATSWEQRWNNVDISLSTSRCCFNLISTSKQRRMLKELGPVVESGVSNKPGSKFNPCTVLRACHTVQFFLQLERNSTLKRCKLVTNVWYVKNLLANCEGNMYLPILHLSRVELRCKL